MKKILLFVILAAFAACNVAEASMPPAQVSMLKLAVGQQSSDWRVVSKSGSLPDDYIMPINSAYQGKRNLAIGLVAPNPRRSIQTLLQSGQIESVGLQYSTPIQKMHFVSSPNWRGGFLPEGFLIWRYKIPITVMVVENLNSGLRYQIAVRQIDSPEYCHNLSYGYDTSVKVSRIKVRTNEVIRTVTKTVRVPEPYAVPGPVREVVRTRTIIVRETTPKQPVPVQYISQPAPAPVVIYPSAAVISAGGQMAISNSSNAILGFSLDRRSGGSITVTANGGNATGGRAYANSSSRSNASANANANAENNTTVNVSQQQQQGQGQWQENQPPGTQPPGGGNTTSPNPVDSARQAGGENGSNISAPPPNQSRQRKR